MTAISDRPAPPTAAVTVPHADDAASSGGVPEREGNPGLVALPLIIAGAVGLGFTNTGVVHNGAAAVPILLSATSVGLLLATIWAAALRQNVNATVYAIFFGFYGSYAVLSIGLTHNWFGISGGDATQTTELWLGSWLLTIGLLTVLTLRLPWTYPALLGVVDIALALLLVGTAADSRAIVHAGGVAVFLFVAFVVYYYVAALWEETGGSALPLGRPLVR
ncbi:GPR1/FUN34/YaaH family transporter [uncultured Williamsia sp.]|uniref:GPR1/FUN34/YaaH family transporter n=1 Tax=uncultured Williamsia sp. TaxID=259311 RepID=UPI0026040076|nr:GPR1/FUN34/YaaH family transporter [uncultured Williamsia sp.]